ncbi:hypothetical protein AB4463_03155 [Vibrio cyclitrophicus]
MEPSTKVIQYMAAISAGLQLPIPQDAMQCQNRAYSFIDKNKGKYQETEFFKRWVQLADRKCV